MRPHLVVHHMPGKSYIILITAADWYADGFEGAYWTAFDSYTGSELLSGYSSGRGALGRYAWSMATKNAKRACTRLYNREARKVYNAYLADKTAGKGKLTFLP